MKQNVIIEKSSELRFKKRPREPYHLTNDAIQTRSYICTSHVDKYDMEYGNLWYGQTLMMDSEIENRTCKTASSDL
jgi:hypothetical protein